MQVPQRHIGQIGGKDLAGVGFLAAHKNAPLALFGKLAAAQVQVAGDQQGQPLGGLPGFNQRLGVKRRQQTVGFFPRCRPGRQIAGA